MIKLLTTFSLLSVLIGSSAYSADVIQYLSPDGNYRAQIIPVHSVSSGNNESEIRIETIDGKSLVSEDYSSDDGSHGFQVVKAAWSSDSKFFVYSISSSGGHQPWHFPTYFISTGNFKTCSIDDVIGAITNPDFILSSSDIIETSGLDMTTMDETNFKLSLKELSEKQGAE